MTNPSSKLALSLSRSALLLFSAACLFLSDKPTLAADATPPQAQAAAPPAPPVPPVPAPPKGSRRTTFSGSSQNWPLGQRLTVDVPLLKSWNPQTFPGLAPADIVADSDASLNGKSVLLKPGSTTQIKWDITLDRPGYYAIFVRGRSPAEADNRKDRLYLTCTIGTQKIALRANFLNQHEDITHFNFYAPTAGTLPITLICPEKSDIPVYIDKVELRSTLGNCAGIAAKTKQVLYTPEQIADIRKNTTLKPDPVRNPDDRKKRDEALWSMQTSPYLPLRMPEGYEPMVPNINPKTGTTAQWEIVDQRYQNHARGMPAYTRETPAPSARFYVKDIKTGDIFPSNDYASGDMTTGEFADDGWGWDARKHSKNNAVLTQAYGSNAGVYFFTANHTSDAWGILADTLNSSAEAYLQTGDPQAARDATILLAELASVYPLIDFNVLAQKNIAATDHKWTPYDATRGGWLYSSWQAAAFAKLARSYDIVFPHINSELSPETLAFIQSKLPHIKSSQDLRALIETNLLQFGADQAIRRHLRGANGTWEFGLASLIAVQQDPTVTKPWVSELWSRTFMSNINEGSLADLLINQGLREGCSNIGQANYASGWQSFAMIADMLACYVRAGADPRYDLSNPIVQPKIIPAAIFPLEVRGAGGFQTNTGEGFTTPADMIRTFPEANGIPEQRAAYRLAFEKLADARAATMLTLLGRYDESDAQWDAIQKAAAPYKANPFRFNATRALSGYGLIYLEAASQDPELANKRAAVLRTGLGFGHGHSDALDLEMYAKGVRVVPDLGLRYVKPDSRKSRAHNVIEVDSSDFSNGPSNAFGTAWADVLHDAGWARFTHATASAATMPQVKQFERSVALIDVSPEDSYVVSLFEVQGGKKHTWCFHGPVSSELTSNALLTAGTEAWDNYLVDHKSPATGIAPVNLELIYKARQGTDVFLKSTLFGVTGLPLATGVSTSFADIHFAYVTKTGNDLSTHWLQLIEPYKSTPFITASRDLSQDTISALEVTTTQGHRDLILFDTQPGPVRTIGDVKFAGRFAIVRFNQTTGKVTRLYLVEGTLLSADGQTLSAPVARQSTTVAAVDFAKNTLTLDKPLTAENPAGGLVLLGSPKRTVPFVVAGLSSGGTSGGTTLALKETPRLYQSPVASVDGKTVKFTLPLAMKRADPRYYNGAFLFNESATRHWIITRSLDDHTVELDSAPDPKDFADTNADGVIYGTIQEVGPGAAASIPSIVEGTVGPDGKLLITRDLGWKR